MIVAVIGEKGGTGKTTLAAHLAGWRCMSGRDVMLVDADRQGSASMWVSIRQELGLRSPQSVQQFGRNLRRSVRDMAGRYDDVVIDVGAGDGVAMETVLRVADTAVIPLQPSAMDMWTISFLNDLAGDSKGINEGLVVSAVLNRAPPHHSMRDVRATLRAFKDFPEIDTLDCVIKERSSIRRAVPTGRLIDEWVPEDTKGRDEMAALYESVFDKRPALALAVGS